MMKMKMMNGSLFVGRPSVRPTAIVPQNSAHLFLLLCGGIGITVCSEHGIAMAVALPLAAYRIAYLD